MFVSILTWYINFSEHSMLIILKERFMNKYSKVYIINYALCFCRDGERKNWDQEDWEHNKPPSDLLQEEEWVVEKGLWTFNSLRSWSGAHCLLQPRPPLRVLQQQVINVLISSLHGHNLHNSSHFEFLHLILCLRIHF